MKYLQDSYNGIYKVVIKPYLPRTSTIILLVVGVLVGLVWAYALSPTIYFDADPRTLQQSWQDEWVKLLADRNAASNFDVSENITSLLAAVDDPLGIVQRLLNTPGEEANFERLQAILPYAQAAQANAPQAPQPSLIANILPFILAPLIAVIVFIAVTLVYRIFLKDSFAPGRARARTGRDRGQPNTALQSAGAAKQAEATLKTNYAVTDLGTPIIQRMSSHLLGGPQYDDSFSIETEAGSFFGECGATVSETIGDDQPTAVEVWLFDKDDFVRTLTRVFASEHAFNDPALRARLSTKDNDGQVTLAAPGATILIETKSLRMQARIVELEYANLPDLPPRSVFKKLTIELAAWQKANATGTAPIAAPAPIAMPAVQPPMPTQPTVAPPPPMPAAPPRQAYPAPTGAAQPAPPTPYAPQQPYAPPTYRPPAPPAAPPPPPRVDDDPFGGTGDFTPVS
jgi:hypothetical protein